MQNRMDFGYGKIRMNVEEDRISSLPDALIHKILSFISIKHAIRTSVLSSRWKLIWTSMPYLNFSSDDDIFPNFVSNVLSHRNTQTQVSSLTFKRFSHESFKNILEYAFSHYVQQLTVTCDLVESNDEIFPLYPLSSRYLKHLVMSGSSPFMETPTWDLPALTTLHLEYITLYSDKCTGLFSKCTNLKNLSLKRCKMMGTNVLNICHPRLSNLTLEHTYWELEAVETQLAIKGSHGKFLISAPGLTSLVIKGGISPLQLSTEGFCSSEKVDLYMSASSPFLETPTWDLPALTTLHLDQITLSDKFKYIDLFSKCPNLKNLSLGGFKVMGTNVLNIFHPRLSNLTLERTYWWVKSFKVVAPQLKNLTITNCYGEHLISALGLTSLVMKGRRPMQLFTKGFPSLEKADLCVSHPYLGDAHKIVCLLQKLHNVKFLTLNLEILDVLVLDVVYNVHLTRLVKLNYGNTLVQ